MTSLHVICGLGPPIKNPGYAFAYRNGFRQALIIIGLDLERVYVVTLGDKVTFQE